MFVDETGNVGTGVDVPEYIGATAVVLLDSDRPKLADAVSDLRIAQAKRGFPMDLEIHAINWVGEMQLFPDYLRVGKRLDGLVEYLDLMANVEGVKVLNVIADLSVSRPPSFDPRLETWRALFSLFENEVARVESFLNQTIKTSIYFDRDRPGMVWDLAAHEFPHFAPVPVNSHEHLEIQLADVATYFMLQSFVPNRHTHRSGHTNAVHRLAKCCPSVKGEAFVEIWEI